MTTQDTILDHVARIGALTAADTAHLAGLTESGARGVLGAAQRQGLVRRARLLAEQPALYTPTRAGLRVAGLAQLATPRLSAAGFEHWLACSRVAAAMIGDQIAGRLTGAQRLVSDRELRVLERQAGARIASIDLGPRRDGAPAAHRPDLALIGDGPALAIEVELTVKAPRRLEAICRGWARSRTAGGVLYVARPRAAAAVARAAVRMYAQEVIAVVAIERVVSGDLSELRAALAALSQSRHWHRAAEAAPAPAPPYTRTIPTSAYLLPRTTTRADRGQQ